MAQYIGIGFENISRNGHLVDVTWDDARQPDNNQLQNNQDNGKKKVLIVYGNWER